VLTGLGYRPSSSFNLSAFDLASEFCLPTRPVFETQPFRSSLSLSFRHYSPQLVITTKALEYIIQGRRDNIRRRPKHVYASNEMLPVQNPLLVAAFAPWFIDLRLHGSEVTGTWPNYKSFSSLPWANNSYDAIDFLKKDAPWRTLQIQDPPATTLIVETRIADRGADNVVRQTFSFPSGVRMGFLYDLTWAHCARIDTVFGVRWDGIPLPANEREKSPQDLGYPVAKWRSERFFPTLGGVEAVLLELYHGEQWFLLNYVSGKGIPDNASKEWEKFRSNGMSEGETGGEIGHIIREERIYEQVY
jgi:hypothetical protein